MAFPALPFDASNSNYALQKPRRVFTSDFTAASQIISPQASYFQGTINFPPVVNDQAKIRDWRAFCEEADRAGAFKAPLYADDDLDDVASGPLKKTTSSGIEYWQPDGWTGNFKSGKVIRIYKDDDLSLLRVLTDENNGYYRMNAEVPGGFENASVGDVYAVAHIVNPDYASLTIHNNNRIDLTSISWIEATALVLQRAITI